jgi:hypothetical protein
MTASNHARAAVADEMKEEPPGEQLETQYAKMVRERLERLRALGESEAAWTCFGKVESCFKSGGLPLVSGGADEIQ